MSTETMKAAEAAHGTAPLVKVRDLKMHFPIHAGLLRRRVGAVKAVDGISDALAQTVYDFFHEGG